LDQSLEPRPVSAGRIHVLSERGIAEAVGAGSAGSYALGYFDGDAFVPFFVGRSDSDLKVRLLAWVGAPSRPRRHAPSPEAPWRSRSGPLGGLGTRALGRIAIGPDTGYTHFSFCYAGSALEAFEKECLDYHRLGGSRGLDNRRHPEPPPASAWGCPVHCSRECARSGG
jgi:hypothetical protein